MAAALISTIYEKKLAKSIIASDHKEENLRNIKSKFKNIRTTTNNKEAVRNSDIVFICVKPQDIDVVLNEIKGEIKNQMVVSIAAGIKINHIESILIKKRVIRLMPNINCLVGEMAAGFCAGKLPLITMANPPGFTPAHTTRRPLPAPSRKPFRPIRPAIS